MLDGGPWSFDNNLLVLSHLQSGMKPVDTPLEEVCFWVHIYNLPVGYFNVKIGQLLARFIGGFVEYDKRNEIMVWRDFMRVRVQLDVRLPLKRHKIIQNPDGDCFKANFKYERLPTFCFLCGILGHSETFCNNEVGIGVDLPRGWGLDRRAPVRKDRRTGGERWLKEEGLGADGADSNMESPRSNVGQGNSVNTGGSRDCMQSVTSRGKAVMETVVGDPQFGGLVNRSTLVINEGRLVVHSGAAGPRREEEEACGL